MRLWWSRSKKAIYSSISKKQINDTKTKTLRSKLALHGKSTRRTNLRRVPKQMTDFTKMSWSKIEQIHTQSNEPVCGMYSQKQLDHWGHEVPSFFSSCTKSAAVLTSIFGALYFQEVEAKPIEISNTVINFSPVEIEKDTIPQIKSKEKSKTILSGILLDKESNEPLLFATLFLKNSQIGIQSDIEGKFTFNIPDSVKIESEILEISYTGYKTLEIYLDSIDIDQYQKIGLLTPKLELEEVNVISFGIRRPTPKERVENRWMKFKKWCKNLF